MIDPIIPKYEEIRNSFDVARMLLIYEMILQAAFDKHTELLDLMTPCKNPDKRTQELLVAIEREATYPADAKAYYKELIKFGEAAWHLWASRPRNAISFFAASSYCENPKER